MKKWGQAAFFMRLLRFARNDTGAGEIAIILWSLAMTLQ
jgi:hypothetical protein